MTSDMTSEECVRFVPLKVEGLDEVREVAAFADRLEITTGHGLRVFYFRDFARRQESLVYRLLRKRFKLYTYPLAVGERWGSCRFHFFTKPPLKMELAFNAKESWTDCDGAQMQFLMARAGYMTYDML